MTSRIGSLGMSLWHNQESLAETYPALQNSQLGPGRTADLVDGVVSVSSACLCVSILSYGKW